MFDFEIMLKTRFVPGSSAQTKAGYVLKYKGENHFVESARFELSITFIIPRWSPLQRLGGGVAGIMGGQCDDLGQ